jgi:para-nitrobenzyl esterase
MLFGISSHGPDRSLPRVDRIQEYCDLPLLILLLALLAGLFACGCGDDEGATASNSPAWTGDPMTRTRSGPVEAVEGNADTWVWKAIPFARPPVGPLRWKAPQDPEPWDGVRTTSGFCEPCAQYFLVGDQTYGSEDCLYLNIWRPRTPEAGLPVYFWIHGGGNSMGTACTEDYNGANLASRSNLVVVTVNYRLGPFGWFTHPALRQGLPGSERDDSGNYGTLDLIQALEWVRDNIEAFGGDPGRVMIAGESAGAMNVFSLLVSPLAEGLFHRAMAESGGPLSSTVAEGEESARNAILKLLINDGTAADRAAAEARLAAMSAAEIEAYLRAKSAREILHAYEPWFGGMITLPNVFEDGTVLPDTGYETLETGTYSNKVPTILGSNKDELKLFMFADPTLAGRDNLYEVVTSYGSDVWKATGVDQPARLLRSHPAQQSVYTYQFLWGSLDENGESELPDPWGFLLGAFHALEIPFFFGNDAFFGALQVLLFTEQNRPGREALSEAMMACAAQFARTGDPNPPGSGLPEWQPWSNETGGPKSILFDVDENQALDIRMSSVELTVEGVLEAMAAEVPEPLLSEAAEYLAPWAERFTDPHSRVSE